MSHSLSFRNIYCVGRNYGKHAAELGNAIPDQPMLFTKPTHAVVPADGGTVILPGNRGEVHYETELVLHIGRAYDPGISVDALVDRMALGIDFTLREVQETLKKKGYPWLPAKGFLQSAPVGPFRPFEGAEQTAQTDFALRINGKEVQRGNIREMIFDLQTIVDFVAANYGLGEGDLIFTGTPAGVGPVKEGDRMELFWGEEPSGQLTVKLDSGSPVGE